MADQLLVTQKAKIGWSELALPIKGRFLFRYHERRARATAFDAEKQRLRGRFLTLRHRAKYFRVRRFCKANADGGTGLLAAADAPLTATKNSKVGIQNTKLGGLSRPEDSTQLHCKFIAFLTDRDFSLSNPRGNAPKLRVLSSALTWH